MNYKRYLKWLLEHNPGLKFKHGMPKTRRDLIGEGLLTGGSLYAMPSLLSLISQVARGQSAQCKAQGGDPGPARLPVLVIDCGGGYGPARNCPPGGQGGQADQLSSYAALGLMNGSEPGSLAQTFRNDPAVTYPDDYATMNTEWGGAAFHPFGRFLSGLNGDPTDPLDINSTNADPNLNNIGGVTARSPATKANTAVRYYCSKSDNDSGDNPANPVLWLAKAGMDGSAVSLIGTGDETPVRGRANPPPESIIGAPQAVRVSSPSDAVGLVVAGVLAQQATSNQQNPNNDFVKKVMSATKVMSERQIKSFNNLSVEQQARILCAFDEAAFTASSFDPTSLNPETDDIINANNGGIFDLGNGTQRRVGTAAKLLLDGYVGGATVTIGGCDYHNNSVQQVHSKDFEIGNAVGAALEAAQRKAKPLCVIVISDGSVAYSGNANNDDAGGLFGPSNDNRNKAMPFLFVYNPSGRPTLSGDVQAGHFDTSGNISVTTDFADSPANMCLMYLLEYLALHHERDKLAAEFKAITGRDPGDLMNYVGFNKIA